MTVAMRPTEHDNSLGRTSAAWCGSSVSATHGAVRRLLGLALTEDAQDLTAAKRPHVWQGTSDASGFKGAACL